MADFQSIYNRLNNGTQFTPLSAQTFGDWSIEAGDIVTVTKDGTSYQTPVMRSGLEWRGASLVTIESTGNKERDALNKLSKQDYLGTGAGSGLHGYYGARRQGFLYLAFEDELASLRSELYMDHEQLRLAFENDINSTRSEFRMTAESLRIAFENDIRCTRSEFLMTAESLRIAFDDDINSLRSEFRLTAESLRIAFEKEAGSIRSELNMSAESLRIAFDNDLNSLRSEFRLTAESLRIGFEDDVNSLRSEFKLTAESMRVAFEDLADSVRSEFVLTAESVRLSFQNDIDSARSEFNMTAESLRVAFDNEAASIRSELQMSADSLRIAFENDLNSTRSAFVISSESIMMAFDDAVNSVRSEFVITAESLRSSFEDDIEGVQSSIQQEADRISLVVDGTGANAHVKPASIVAAITDNNGVLTSSIDISADHVNLSGTTKLNDAMTVYGNFTWFKKPVIIASDLSSAVTIENGTVSASSVHIGGRTANVIDVQPNNEGTLLTITYTDGTTKTFRKAAATSKISGSWSGGIFTVAADDQNGQQPPLATTTLKVVLSGNPTVSGKKVRQDAQVWYFDPSLSQYTSNPYSNTGMADQQIEIDATGVYNNGWDAALADIVRTTDTAGDQDITIKTLTYGERWTITDTRHSSSGTPSVIKYTVKAPDGAVATPVITTTELSSANEIKYSGIPIKATSTLGEDSAEATTEISLRTYRYTPAGGTTSHWCAEIRHNGTTIGRRDINDLAVDATVKLDRNYSSGGNIIDAVVPVTDGTGSSFLRVQVEDNGLTSSGTRRIRGLVGSTSIYDTTFTDYKDGQNSIINAGSSLTVTANTNGSIALNRYVTTYYVNVPTASAKVKLIQNYSTGSTVVDNAVVPTTDGTGSNYLRAWVKDYGLVQSTGKRIIDAFVGSTSIFSKTYTDYLDGKNSIINAGSPLTITSNTSSAVTLNRYVTTYTVNVPTGGSTTTPKVKFVQNYTSGSTVVDNAIIPTTDGTGSAYLRVQVEDNGLTSSGTRRIRGLAGSSVFFNTTYTDYRDGRTAGQSEGENNLINAGGPYSVSTNGTQQLNRYVSTLTVNVAGGGTATVAKPVFSANELSTSTTIQAYADVKATSTSGNTSSAETDRFTLQTSTVSSTNYAELYWNDGKKVIARIKIANTSATVTDAEVVFNSWTRTTGNNAGEGNTVRFANASNSKKFADLNLFLSQDNGWAYLHDGSPTGLVVSKIQVQSGGSDISSATVQTFSEYNSTAHTYNVYAQAKINGSVVGNAVTVTTGTEAYDAGKEDGRIVGLNEAWNEAKNSYGPTPAPSPPGAFNVRIPTNNLGVTTITKYGIMLISNASNATGDMYLIKNYGDDNLAETVMTVNVNSQLSSIYQAGVSEGSASASHNIQQSGSAWTTGSARSGWIRISGFVRQYEIAKEDGDLVAFEVKCGDATRVFYAEP